MSQKLANATGLYLEGIRDGNVRAAVEAYTGDRYTQHSTGVADGNHVFVHVYQDINNGQARWVTTDLFDTDDQDKIVEHWDVIAAFVDESANGHTQVDGPTEIVDEDRTEVNKAMVASFIDDVLVHHRVDRIGDYVSAAGYVQHNPLVADGIDVFRDFMHGPGTTMVYRDVFKIIGQGNLVMSYSLVGLDGTDMAVFDLFRVEDGLIVEHWDNMEPIPEGPQPNSGKF